VATMRIEDNKALLIKNIELSESLIQEMLRLDTKVDRIMKKPIRLGCFGHFIMLAILCFAVMSLIPLLVERLYWDGDFETVIAIILIMVCFSYMVIVLVINRTALAMKKSDHAKFLKEYPMKRKLLFLKLTAESVIPAAYWSMECLYAMKTYLNNKRADNLKEAINILEEEMRHNARMSQLAAIQDQLSQPQFFVGFTID
jgi:hypothetical protein